MHAYVEIGGYYQGSMKMNRMEPRAYMADDRGR